MSDVTLGDVAAARAEAQRIRARLLNGPQEYGEDSRREYVKGVLDDALVIVAELEVPTDLAPVALAKAIDLLAAVKG